MIIIKCVLKKYVPEIFSKNNPKSFLKKSKIIFPEMMRVQRENCLGGGRNTQIKFIPKLVQYE